MKCNSHANESVCKTNSQLVEIKWVKVIVRSENLRAEIVEILHNAILLPYATKAHCILTDSGNATDQIVSLRSRPRTNQRFTACPFSTTTT